MIIKLTILAVLISFLGHGAEARNCKKGKPCGNSCISQKDVCHIGESQASKSETATKDAPGGAVQSTPDVAKKHKDCKKGKPCGDGCISMKATCHAG